MKGLKTYFTYLHRNKLFTLVNVVGLSISLMFVLLIANRWCGSSLWVAI